jgi:hypothetical protein
MARTKLSKRYSKRRRKNPEGDEPPASSSSDAGERPLMEEVAGWVVPGFAGFAATRFTSYVASTQIAKRKPEWAIHSGAAVAVGSFLALWWFAGKIKMLRDHHTPIVVGSAIAALQSLIQMYIPQLGWMLADPSHEVREIKGTMTPGALDAVSQLALQPSDEDPNEFSWNDSYDAGRYGAGAAGGTVTSPPFARPQTAAASNDLQLDDLVGTQNLGVFAGNS